jgi:anti-sigma factor RsiW
MRLMDYASGVLEPAHDKPVRLHLENCPKCQALLAELQQLDQALESTMSASQLSPGFRQRVWNRIAQYEAGASRRTPQPTREQLEAEFAANLASVRRGLFLGRGTGVLDVVGYATAAGLAGYYVSLLFARLLAGSATALSTLNSQMITVATVFSAAVLFASLAFVARRSLRRLLLAL